MSMRITVLIYCARSGSTFLANQISKDRAGVVVVPEFRTPNLLLWRGEAEVRALDAEGLAALFRRDMQFSNLGLSEDETARLCATLAGRSRGEILEGLLDAFRTRHGLPGAHFLVKNGGLAFQADALREALPEADFLHIQRDPRGVVNSMMTTRTVYSYGGPMAGGDPLKAAELWLRHRAATRAIRAPVASLRYEALMTDPASAAKTLDALFGPPEGEATPAPAAEAVVSEKERSLHKLVGKSADRGRTEAWKTAIAPRTGMAIEALLGAALVEEGYAPHFAEGVPAARLAAALRAQRLRGRGLLAKHAALTGLHWAKESLKAPGEVLFRIENAVRARN